MNRLTEHEVREFMINQFAPSVQRVLFRSNPREFARWMGSCCNAMAVLCREELSAHLPDMDFRLISGVYRCTRKGVTSIVQHAWLREETHMISIDLAHHFENRLWVRSGSPEHPWCSRRKFVTLRQKDASDDEDFHIQHIEFFSGKTGNELLMEVQDLAEAEPMGGSWAESEKWLAAYRPKDEVPDEQVGPSRDTGI